MVLFEFEWYQISKCLKADDVRLIIWYVLNVE